MAATSNKQKARKIAILKLRFHLMVSILTLLLIVMGTYSKNRKSPEPVIKSIKIEKKLLV